jgi:long-chain fatty acid transport protein
MRRIGLFSLAAAAAALHSGAVEGAAFGLKEHSADAMASAYAGAAATQSDASYLVYNPASLAGVNELDVSFSIVEELPGTRARYSTAITSAGNPNGGSTTPRGYISDATLPAFGLRQRLSDSWAVGLSISVPWGVRTDYPPNWAGRYYAQKSSLFTINATPVVSYQVTQNFSFGAGVQVEYAQGALTSAIDTGTLGALNAIPGSIPGAQDSFARLSGSDWAFGYMVGVIERFHDATLGVAYRSSLQHHLTGPLKFTLDSSGIGATIRSLTGLFTDSKQTTPVTTPDMITSGARVAFSDDWTGLAELDWTNWSRAREIRVHAFNPAQPDEVTTLRWKDAFFASLGAEYHASPLWTFRAGTGYDQTPVTDANREPRFPDGDRIWLSAGVRYRMTNNADLNVTAAHVFFPQSNIALNPSIPGAALRGSLTGTSQAYANVIALQFSYRAD